MKVQHCLTLVIAFSMTAVIICACGSSRPLTTTAAQAASSSSATPNDSQGARRPGYSAARKEWLAEGDVIGSAAQSLPIERAIADLARGEHTDAGNTSTYPAVIAVLKSFASIPDAMVSKAQQVQGRADAIKLDQFFRIDGNIQCARWPSTAKSCWEY
jgi:hypothetical protein